MGFVDPCDINYINHLDRSNDGKIIAISNLGNDMYFSLKLHKPQHQIIWKLENLEPTIKHIKTNSSLNKLPEQLKDRIIQLFIRYDDYRDELRNV